MRRLWWVSFFLVGCSIDTSGLGDDTVDALDDTSVSSDESGALFDADESDSALVDTTVVDTSTPDTTVADTTVADVPVDSVTLLDTSDDSAADSAMDTGTDTAVDSGAPDTETDTGALADSSSMPDVAPPDSGSPLMSAAGELACASGTCKGQRCCGSLDFSGWHWSCHDACGFGQREYRCDEKADCDPGKICCASRVPVIGTINGSDCRDTCGGDPQLCMTDAECGSGKSCAAQKAPDSPQTIGVCK